MRKNVALLFIIFLTGTSVLPLVSIADPLSLTEEPQSRIVDQWDWRNVDGIDWTTAIRNQLQDKCGSCWAFGVLGALEPNYKIWMNDPDLDIDFSEQFILSCSPGSCDGWYLTSTLSWIKHNGVIFEECMPYQADDTIPCESKCEDWYDQLIGIRDYTKLPRGDIAAIQEALISYGPLPATMEVYGDFYPEWDGGVYEHTSGDFVFGHVVTIVGFDYTWGDDDQGYWICKNSWGTSWGEDGWFRIAYGECSIENSVYYLEGPNFPPSKPDKPDGPVTGKPNVEYTFSATCFDPDDDDLYYLFDWGDGNDSGWIGPFESGETVYINYSWESKGTYSVRLKTREFLGPRIFDYGIESQWSDPLEVAMPKNLGFTPGNWLLEKIIHDFLFLRSIFSLCS